MPDALQMLREQHDEVKEIFKKFSSTDDAQTRKSLAQQAMVKLEMHSNLEEEFFYPAVRSEGGTTQLMNEAEEEHHVADLLMDELRRMSPNDDRYEAKFEVLAESVKHHIDEEESEIFPKAAELGPDRLGQLGAAMEKRKPALTQQAEKMMTSKPGTPRSRGGERGTSRRTTRAAGTGRTTGTTTRARSTSRRTTRASTSRAGSARTMRGTASRSAPGRTTRASASSSTKAARTARASSSRATSGRSASGGTTRGTSARSSNSARSTRAASSRSSRASSARPARTGGTSRGQKATESRRRPASRPAGARGGSSRR